MSDNLAERLAAFALEHSIRRPARDGGRRGHAGDCWTHLGCAVGALDEPAPTIARRVAARFQGSPSASVIGGGTVRTDWAAFANGVHIRYLDCNDTYLSLEPAHPSDNWAAVMAAGEAVGADGRAWIAAAAVAYEVQCRLCDAASIRARGWDHTTYGSLSTALAAARLLGLSHEQTVHALGIAGTTGTALRLTRAGELSMWKGCAFAFAARNGVFAALLAADGMTGPAPLFEGDMGFFQQVSGPLELPKLGGPAADDWMLPKTSIKFVPAEYHSQSAIAAAFELRPEIGDPARIRSIEIATFRDGRRDHRPGPREMASARPARPPTTACPTARPSPWSTARSRPRSSPPNDSPTPPCSTWSRAPRSSKIPNSPPATPRASRTGSPSRSTTAPSSSSEVAFPPGHDKNPLTDEQLADKFHGLVDRPRARACRARSKSELARARERRSRASYAP